MSSWRVSRHYGFGAARIPIQPEVHRAARPGLREAVAELSAELIEGGLLLMVSFVVTVSRDHSDFSPIEVVFFESAPVEPELLPEPIPPPVALVQGLRASKIDPRRRPGGPPARILRGLRRSRCRRSRSMRWRTARRVRHTGRRLARHVRSPRRAPSGRRHRGWPRYRACPPRCRRPADSESPPLRPLRRLAAPRPSRDSLPRRGLPSRRLRRPRVAYGSTRRSRHIGPVASRRPSRRLQRSPCRSRSSPLPGEKTALRRRLERVASPPRWSRWSACRRVWLQGR